jgi:hypothetical protein
VLAVVLATVAAARISRTGERGNGLVAVGVVILQLILFLSQWGSGHR